MVATKFILYYSWFIGYGDQPDLEVKPVLGQCVDIEDANGEKSQLPGSGE